MLIGNRYVLGGAMLALTILPGALRAQGAQEPQIPWETGPVEGSLGSQSKVKVAEMCLFTAAEGSKMFMELTQNPPSGRERGTAFCNVYHANGDTAQWFAVFEYDATGYIKDDEKAELDAAKILATLKKGNEAGNKLRRERGWETISLVGWAREPYYDAATNNLTWATKLRDDAGDETINHSVRLLGRGGVMSVDLVVTPADYEAALGDFNNLVATHEYNPGSKYAEWRDGDKVAAYGLTALVAGGAGALAVKSGLLGKLWKVIAAAAIAVVAGFKRFFSRKQEA